MLLVAILPAEPLDDYLFKSCFWCVHCRILFLSSRFMIPKAFNIGSLPFNADCGLLSIRDASGIFHLLKYGLLAYFDLTSRTMARGWRRYDGWPRKKSFDSYVLLSNLKTHRPQHMYFDICRSKNENVKLFWYLLIITIRGQKRTKMHQKRVLKMLNWKKIISQLRKYIFPTGK